MNRGRPRKRNSPARYEPEIKSRDKSRGRKEKADKSPARTTRSKSASRRKSPIRRSPSDDSDFETRPKTKSKTKTKSASPSRTLRAKVKRKIEEIRDSLTPDRKLVEEVVRSSVQKFEEVAADVVSSVKKMTRGRFKEEYQKNKKSQDEEDSDSSVRIIYENNVKPVIKVQRDFSGLKKSLFALLFILLHPALVFWSHAACVPGNCSLVPNITLTWDQIIDKDATIWYTTFLLGQIILACLPLGFKTDGVLNKGHRLTYRNNGMATFVLTLGAFYGVHHFTSFRLTKLLDKTIAFLFVTIVFSLAVSVALYLKSVFGKVIRNPLGNTGHTIYDFWAGGEVNPRIGPLDVKTTIFRTSFITLALYNLLSIWKEVEGKSAEHYSVPLIAVSALQIWLCLDYLVFESSTYSSYTVTQEGTGYFLTMAIMIYPFWLALQPKYLQIVKVKNNLFVVVPAVLLYFIGYVIYRVSNEQKTRFVRNQRGEKLHDVIQERRSGTNLFRGGLWGIVRHPNYTGFILLNVSLGILTGSAAPLHWIPVMLPLWTILEHLYQIYRVEQRGPIRHPTSWTTYTLSTKNRLIPFIF